MASSLMRRSGISSSLNPLSSSVNEDTNTRMVINPIAAHGTTNTNNNNNNPSSSTVVPSSSTGGGNTNTGQGASLNNHQNNTVHSNNSINGQGTTIQSQTNNLSNAINSRSNDKVSGQNTVAMVAPNSTFPNAGGIIGGMGPSLSPTLSRSASTPTPVQSLNANGTMIIPPSPSTVSNSRTNHNNNSNNNTTLHNNGNVTNHPLNSPNMNNSSNSNNNPSVWPKVFQISKRLAMYFSTLVGSGCYTALAIALWGSSETSTAATAILSVLGVTLAANCVLAWLYKAAIDDHDTVSALQNNPPLAASLHSSSSSNPNLLLDGRTIDGGVPGRDPDTELYLTFLFLLAGLHPRHILLYASHRTKPLAYQIQRLPPGSPIPPAPLAPAMLIFAVRWSIAATITIDFVMLIITIAVQGITIHTPVASMVLACLLISIFNVIISLTYSVALCSRVRATGMNYGDTFNNDRNNNPGSNNGWNNTPRQAPVTILSDNNGNRNRMNSPGKSLTDSNDYQLQQALHSSSPVIVNGHISPQNLMSGSSSPLPLPSSDRHARVARTTTTASSLNGQMNNPRFPSNGTPSLTITASGNNNNGRNVPNNFGKPGNTSISSPSTPYSHQQPPIPLSHSPPHPALHHQLSAPELTSHHRSFPGHNGIPNTVQFNPSASPHNVQTMVPVMTTQNGIQRIQLIPASMLYGNNAGIPVSPTGHPISFVNNPYGSFIPNSNPNQPIFVASPNPSNMNIHANRSPGQLLVSPSINAGRPDAFRDNTSASVSRRSITGEMLPAAVRTNPGNNEGINSSNLRRNNSVSEQDSPHEQGQSTNEQVTNAPHNNNNGGNDQPVISSSSRKLPSVLSNSGVSMNIPMHNGNMIHNPVHMENVYNSNTVHPALASQLSNTPSIINIGGVSYAVASPNGNPNILMSENGNHMINGIPNSTIPLNMMSNEQVIQQGRLPFHTFPVHHQGMAPRNVIIAHPSEQSNHEPNNNRSINGPMVSHPYATQIPVDPPFAPRIPAVTVPVRTASNNQGPIMHQHFDEEDNTHHGTEDDAEYQEYIHQQQQQSQRSEVNGVADNVSRTLPVGASSIPTTNPGRNRSAPSNVLPSVSVPADHRNNNSSITLVSNVPSNNNRPIATNTDNTQPSSSGLPRGNAEVNNNTNGGGVPVTSAADSTTVPPPVHNTTNTASNTGQVTHRRHLQDDDPK